MTALADGITCVYIHLHMWVIFRVKYLPSAWQGRQSRLLPLGTSEPRVCTMTSLLASVCVSVTNLHTAFVTRKEVDAHLDIEGRVSEHILAQSLAREKFSHGSK